MLKNSRDTYGTISVFAHWSIALLIIGLFAMGVWMRTLTYYDPWYNRAPDLHISLGLLVFVMMIVRILLRRLDPTPDAEASLKPWETRLSHLMHQSLYLAAFVIIVTGYLIPTADGVGVSFFGLFEVPAVVELFERQEDVAGWIHWALAWLMMGAVLLHAAAALKHHFIDRDRTLLKMLGRKPTQ